jgi:hypothetical protein
MASGKSGAHWKASLVVFIFRQDNRQRGGWLIEKTWPNSQKIDVAFSISLRMLWG